MDITAIIELVLSLLEMCNKREGADTTKTRIKNFGVPQERGFADGELMVRLHLRARGMRRGEINQAIDELKMAAASASDDDLDHLLAAAAGEE